MAFCPKSNICCIARRCKYAKVSQWFCVFHLFLLANAAFKFSVPEILLYIVETLKRHVYLGTCVTSSQWCNRPGSLFLFVYSKGRLPGLVFGILQCRAILPGSQHAHHPVGIRCAAVPALYNNERTNHCAKRSVDIYSGGTGRWRRVDRICTRYTVNGFHHYYGNRSVCRCAMGCSACHPL